MQQTSNVPDRGLLSSCGILGVVLCQVEAAIKSGFVVPRWITDLTRHAEQCGWLLERNMEYRGTMAHRFFKNGRWVSVICESNGISIVKDEARGIAEITIAPDGSKWLSQVKPLFH